ncbi:hypothetical protein PENSUB_749 [Penicillium subrubescens]|uniref:DUF7702 domain-containing protein n=2 Tax=Penicillium subrubescens TaxID=1316194 RepID=A0A1Q5UM30_9EURO|nr:hypothetical protein PENSUB_749 [Penicillium subrubescens]
MLGRINKVVTIVAKLMFWIPSIVTWIDIGISIGGWVSVTQAEHSLAPTPWSRASIALLAFIYLYLVGIFILFWLHKAEYFAEERWALAGVAFCVPLLAIRVAYSLIFVITGNIAFNAMKGNPTLYLIMTMLPEFFIIAACTYIIATRISPLVKTRKKVQQTTEEEESRQRLSIGS